MIQLTAQSDASELIRYLKEDIQNCLYIYIDLSRYGLENPNMRVWVEKNGQDISSVLMKYHNGFQIYSRNSDYNIENVQRLIERYKPVRISGTEPMIRHLEKLYKHQYKSTYGMIFCRTKYQTNEILGEKRCAFTGLTDIPEIADLLLTEKEFGDYYNREELIAQLEDRYHTNMGRSMVIRESGKIVGHMATFAETDDIVIVSGAVMHKDYRNTDYFNMLNDEFHDQICRIEKKDAYFFSTSKRHITFFSKCFVKCADYGKLVKI